MAETQRIEPKGIPSESKVSGPADGDWSRTGTPARIEIGDWISSNKFGDVE